jgi:hypothetical protein
MHVSIKHRNIDRGIFNKLTFSEEDGSELNDHIIEKEFREGSFRDLSLSKKYPVQRVRI